MSTHRTNFSSSFFHMEFYSHLGISIEYQEWGVGERTIFMPISTEGSGMPTTSLVYGKICLYLLLLILAVAVANL